MLEAEMRESLVASKVVQKLVNVSSGLTIGVQHVQMSRCVCVLLDGWDYEWISRKNNCKSVTIYFFRLRPQAYEKLENMKVQFCDLVVNTRKSYFYKK